MASAWRIRAMVMWYKAVNMSHTSQGLLGIHPVGNGKPRKRSEQRRHGRLENLKASPS